MKKLLLLTKTLLAAALLCVGQNAWGGEITTLYERGTTNAWSDADVTAWACNAGTVTIDGGLKNAFGNTGWAGTMSITPTSNAIVTLTASLQGANTGRSGAYDYIKIGGVSLRLDGQSQVATLDIDGQSTQLATGIARGGTFSIVITIDTSNGDVSYSYNGGASTLASARNTSAISNVEIGYHKNGSLAGGTYILKNIEVKNETQDVETADYTINYKNNESIVKTVSGNVAVGTEIAILSSFYESDVKYIKNGGEPSSLTVAKGGSNLNVAVSVAAQYTCTVNAKAGETLLASPSTTIYEGENAKIFYKKAYKNGGTWYITPANGSYPWYAHNFNDVSANSNYDVTTYAANENIVYFGEVEEMNLSGSFAADGGQPDRYSNGVAKRLYSNGGGTPSGGSWVYTDEIPAGVYSVTMWARNQSGKQTATLPVYLRDSEGNMTDLSTSFEAWAAGAQGEKSVEITIPNDGKTYSVAIYNYSGYNSNLEMDYVYVTFVRPLSVSATIGSMGYTTFSSSYPLNLDEISGGIAYKVVESGVTTNAVNPTAVSGSIAAGEGLLLAGEAGATVTIPVAASGDAISGNLMIGCPTGETLNSSTPNYETCYVLINGDTEAEFANLTNWISGGNDVTIPEGKAYLNTTAINPARSLRISFDDITGVANVEAAAEAKAKEGKFIENGKLVIVKNGQKFNAAGAQVK